MSEEKEDTRFDTSAYTGDTSGGLAAAIGRLGKAAGEAIERGDLTHALNEAKDVPLIMAAAGATGTMAALAAGAKAVGVPMLAYLPVIPIIIWSHVQRTKANMEADKGRPVDLGEARRESLRLLAEEFGNANLKSAIEFAGRDRNGDGKVTTGEYVKTAFDIMGNYLPADGQSRKLLLDSVETTATYFALDGVGQVTGAAMPAANNVEKAGVGLVIAVPTVAGVISISKRDEAVLDSFRETPLGQKLHKLLMDGCPGEGDDSYFDLLGKIAPKQDDPVYLGKPDLDRTIPADAPTYSLGGEPENNIVMDPYEMDALAAGASRRRGGYVGKKPDLPGFVDAASIKTVAANAAVVSRRKPGAKPGGTGGMS